MKFKFVRSGGFAGIKTTKTVDTDNLNPTLAEKVQSLFAKVSKIAPKKGEIMDGLSYAFEQEGSSPLQLSDADMSEELEELISCILDLPKETKAK